MADKKMEHGKGKCVSRSVYQKVCEENRRLRQDLYTLVMRPVTGESILVRGRWKDQFEKEKELAKVLHDYAEQYVKDNPDSIVAQIAREFPSEKYSHE